MLKRTIFLILTASALHAEPGPLEKALVTIPYSELKSLWEAGQSPKREIPEPPIAAQLLAARYDLAFEAGQVRGTAEFEVQCFRDKWTVVPFLDTGAQIDGIEPADANLIIEKNRYALALEHAGKTKIKVHFAAKLVSEAGVDLLQLGVAPAAINTINLANIPENKTVSVENSTPVSVEKGKAGFRLSARDSIKLSLLTPTPPLPPPTLSRWQVSTESLVESTDGKLSYETMVEAHTETGSGLSMELQLPAGARVTRVSGDDLARWQVGNPLRIEWKTRDVLSRVVDVCYEIPHVATPGEWRLHAPSVVNGENGDALYAMIADPEFELRPKQALTTRLPRWLVERTSGQNVITSGADGLLVASWQPLVPTTPAVIENVQAAMRVVGDGALLNELSYVVRHDGPLAWKLRLPDSSQLLTCAVEGRATSPIDRGKGAIELQLKGSANKRQQTEIKISYLARKPAFQPVSGQLEVELPATDLLTQKIDWALQIPSIYEITALQGNVESSSGGAPGAIKLRKELCKDEQPIAQLFYQKPETR